MADVNLKMVSQKVVAKFDEITLEDGNKGVSSRAERDKLAAYLASGEVTGDANKAYVQKAINEFDLAEVAKQASDGIKKLVKNIMKSDSNGMSKNEIDTNTELAALDAIINSDEYSVEDRKYASMVKAQSEFAIKKAAADLLKAENLSLRDENGVLREQNTKMSEQIAQLMSENEQLREDCKKNKDDAVKFNDEVGNMLETSHDIPPKACEEAKTVLAGTNKLNQISDEIVGLCDDLDAKQQLVEDGKIAPKTFGQFVKAIEGKLEEKKREMAQQKEVIFKSIESLSEQVPELGNKIASFAQKLLGYKPVTPEEQKA